MKIYVIEKYKNDTKEMYKRERKMCGKLYQNWKRGKKAFLIISLIRKDFFLCKILIWY